MSNNTDELGNDPTARNASEWLTRLETGGVADPTEFDRWIREDPAHAREFLEITYADIELQRIEFTGDAPAADLVREIRVATARKSPARVVQFPREEVSSASTREQSGDSLDFAGRPQRRRNWRVAPFGFGAALCAVLVGITGAYGLFSTGEVYETGVGEQRTVHLKDGTVIELNTASRLAVRLTESSRVAELIKGEAVFDIAPDRRQFRVLVGPAVVDDVGTRFLLRRDERQLSVAVLEGRVEVRPAMQEHNGTAGTRRTVKLGPHDALAMPSIQYRASEVHRLTDTELVRLTSWMEGVVRLDGETLADVVTEMNRYSPRQIVIADPSIALTRVGGSWRVGQIDQFLNALERAAIARRETDRMSSVGPIRLVAVDP